MFSFYRKKAEGALLFAVVLILSINLACLNKTQNLKGKLRVTAYQDNIPIATTGDYNNIYIVDNFILEKITAIFDTTIFNPVENVKILADTTLSSSENYKSVKHSTIEKLTGYLISNLISNESSKFDISKTDPNLIEKFPSNSNKKEGLQLSDYLSSINLPMERLNFSKDTLLNDKTFKMFIDTIPQTTASGLRIKTICYLDPNISNLSFHLSKEFDQRNHGFLSRIDVFYKNTPSTSLVYEFKEGLNQEEIAFIQRYISLSEKR